MWHIFLLRKNGFMLRNTSENKTLKAVCPWSISRDSNINRRPTYVLTYCLRVFNKPRAEPRQPGGREHDRTAPPSSLCKSF